MSQQEEALGKEIELIDSQLTKVIQLVKEGARTRIPLCLAPKAISYLFIIE